MERNYTKIWWQHCLAIIGFSVIPLLIVNIALFLLFNRIYTDKVSENLQNRIEDRRDTVDLFPRHFSGRGLKQRQSLWGSFTLETGTYTIYRLCP